MKAHAAIFHQVTYRHMPLTTTQEETPNATKQRDGALKHNQYGPGHSDMTVAVSHYFTS